MILITSPTSGKFRDFIKPDRSAGDNWVLHQNCWNSDGSVLPARVASSAQQLSEGVSPLVVLGESQSAPRLFLLLLEDQAHQNSLFGQSRFVRDHLLRSEERR